MPLYTGFSPESSKLLLGALGLVLGTINQDFERKQQTPNPLHAEIILEWISKEMSRVSETMKFVSAKVANFGVYPLPENANTTEIQNFYTSFNSNFFDFLKSR